jgi:ABC-type amino acid transport substrate-binding protein
LPIADKGLGLTQAEKDWLKDHPVIRVGGPKAFPPFHYYDEQGKPKGIGPEYVYLILEALGLKVEYSKPLPWPKVLENIKTGGLDLIACAAKSKDREGYLSYSKPYLLYPLVIVTKTDAPFVGGIGDLHGKSIALTRKVSTHQWLKRDGVEFKPFFINQPLEGLKAVSLGQADAYIENLAAAAFMIQKYGLLNLKIAAPTEWGYYQLFFAARKDWPQLTSIMNKVLATLDEHQLSAIRSKWITVRYEHGIRIWDVLKWIILILVPALVVLLLFFLHNRRLRTEVVERQKEVAERKKAEAKLNATVEQLQGALADIKQLSGLLPICASCKKIRDDQGYWRQVEEYISVHSEAEFSHSVCPDCMKKLYPNITRRLEKPGGAKDKS